jgi:bifunctional DNase/RNase
MSEEGAIEMFVGGLVLDPATQAPVVVLRDASGEIHIPIWIGVNEATSIASALKDIKLPRPLTHDLMSNIFNEVGITVQSVTITDLQDSTYISKLSLAMGERLMVLDARPSDAIALAVRTDAPIFVNKEVVAQARIVATVVEVEEAEDSPSASGSDDFQQIDKDRWSELLENLDPEDFKFKV